MGFPARTFGSAIIRSCQFMTMLYMFHVFNISAEGTKKLVETREAYYSQLDLSAGATADFVENHHSRASTLTLPMKRLSLTGAEI